MRRCSRFSILIGSSALLFSPVLTGMPGEDPPAEGGQLPVSHAECSYFGPQRERFVEAALRASGGRLRSARSLSSITSQVAALLPPVPGGSRTHTLEQSYAPGSIDSYIFGPTFEANNITPALATTDWEFIRRVTLDLTGRIPTPDRVAELRRRHLARQARQAHRRTARHSPEWMDKWTMYFGDLYQNTDQQPAPALRRYPAGPQRVLPVDPRLARQRQAVQPDGHRADHRAPAPTATPTARPTGWSAAASPAVRNQDIMRLR